MKEVTEEFLCPATYLVNGTVVLQDFLDAAAVAEPIELGAPQVLPVVPNSPSANGGFTNEGMVVLFGIGTSSGAKTDGAEASTFQC